MEGYTLGKDIQEIKDRLATIEGQLSRPKQPCKPCGSVATAMEGREPSTVRLPPGAKVWIQLSDCSTENAGVESHVVLRGKSGVRIEVATMDVEEVKGMTLLRHGAKVHNFRKLNPELTLAACDDLYYPNECYFNDTSCVVFVLICHSCCYDENGVFRGEESEACGICIGG